MAIRISFIVPTFNRAAYLAEALDAIIAQAGPDDEILVIDDGSTDGTDEIVAGYTGTVRYERQENAGKSVALNRAMALTNGEFVWICDDDDILLPGAVDALVSAILQSGSDIAFGRYYPFMLDQAGEHRRLEFHWPDLTKGSVARHLFEDSFIMQNAALVRRACYHAVGEFDETMLRSLDYEMFVRLLLAYNPIFVDREIFAQRKHEGMRGPATMLHDAAKSENVWVKFDQRIFRTVDAQVPIDFFAGMFDADDDRLALRAGYLQRACIFARHLMWDLAIRDLRKASAILPDRPLEREELDICSRFLAGKGDMAGSEDADVRQGLRDLYRAGGVPRQSVIAILRGGTFRLRRRQGGDVRNILDLAYAVGGPQGLVDLAKATVRHKRSSAPDSAPAITERDQLVFSGAPAMALAR